MAQPEQQEAPVSVQSIQQESGSIVESREKIAYASPDALRDAIMALNGSDAGESDIGIELIFIASKILEILYPLYVRPDVQVSIPSGGIYPRLFDSVVTGSFPRVSQEDATFFTLVIPPLAMLYTVSENVAELSEESLNRALSLNPQSVLALYLMGLLAERRQELPEAESFYNRAVSLAMSCYPAHIGRARILLALDRPADALSILEQLTPSFPEDPDVLELTARSHLRLGNLSEASGNAAEALRRDPDNLDLLLLRAQVLYAQGSGDQAERFLSIVEERKPDDRDVILLRGTLLFDEGRLQEALTIVERGSELFPHDPAIADQYGKILFEIGREADGREVLRKNLETNPDRVSSLELLLEDAAEKGLWNDSLSLALRLMTIDEKPAYLFRAYEAATALGDAEGSLGYAEKLYAGDPSNDVFRSAYIRALLVFAETERAGEVIEEGLSAQTGSAERSELYYLRSFTRGDRNGRLEDLQAALLEDLLNVDALVSISAIYEQEGDLKKAYRFLKQAAAIDSSDAELLQKLEELESRL